MTGGCCSCNCFLCGKPMERKIKWFATNGKTYYGLFFCEEHGLIKGRFKIKHTDDEQYYAVKIFKAYGRCGRRKAACAPVTGAGTQKTEKVK